MRAEEVERLGGGAGRSADDAPGEVEASQGFEGSEERHMAPPPSGLGGGLQEIEVVPHQGDDGRRDEAVEQGRAEGVVGGAVEGLADVVDERGEPEPRVGVPAVGVVEDLEAVGERVTFGVVLRALGDAVEGHHEVVPVEEERVL